MQAQRGPLHKLYWHCGITEWEHATNDWREHGLVKELAKEYPSLFGLPEDPESRLEIYTNLSNQDWNNVNAWRFFGQKVKRIYMMKYYTLLPILDCELLNQFRNCSLA